VGSQVQRVNIVYNITHCTEF